MSGAGSAALDRVRTASDRLAHGDWSGGGDALREALRHVPASHRSHPLVRRGWRDAGTAVALDERWDDAGAVERELRGAAGGDVARRLALEGTRAVGLALAGRPRDALRAVTGVRRIAVDAGMTSLCAALDLAETLVARETGDRELAESALEQAARDSRTTGFGPLVPTLALVQLRLETGRPEQAAVALARADATAWDRSEPSPGSGVRSCLGSAHLTLCLVRGDVDGARSWVEVVTDPFWGPAGEARILLAQGRGDAAATVLARARPRGPRHEVVGGLLTARALAGRDREAALGRAGVAAEVAVRHGMVRSVAAEGGTATDLLEREAWRVPSAWMDRVRHAQAPVPVAEVPPTWPLEGLTGREREVLRLLPGRLTLREVADELVVSPNTLKFHLRTVYRKLGAGSRTEAVAVARRAGLLPRV
ncbi:LuxR family transcriptional regulator [Aeromicrobium sp. IC_218]|uniref:LuxR family transcriptional regulator n=1 Tax=Aeromicrobium sp. IC_218 TaxID=2545468 RepID=UPI00103AF582|nr:LuxR family transcriptional regulator [Aeromicrobium sp. IC_218]TCI97645.1 LuxR family transcriptional regulator [Aeromicrobium sp. IC_218]